MSTNNLKTGALPKSSTGVITPQTGCRTKILTICNELRLNVMADSFSYGSVAGVQLRLLTRKVPSPTVLRAEGSTSKLMRLSLFRCQMVVQNREAKVVVRR
jgi:hypothetical protein